MYIKSIIIDGFKSYRYRTEVAGFDPEFNAITGLNGTGKSNILDSICFVLGISNLVHVRATSLQDLVYMSGQAGVHKATVTLIFDNSNPNQCPIGFENCNEISITRQIVVGGKNKYLINGKSVQNKRVQDLFCSVQLNVNNPNFLIMQGRITKVLNMKPPEILSMIEEAAGTSMYEAKRDSALKLIEKKDAKLNELYAVMSEEIEPKLEKLRREREHYIEFQKVCRDIEYLTRLYVSYRYLQLCKGVEESEKTIASLQSVIGESEQKIESNNRTAEQLEQDAKELQERIDSEGGGVLSELEQQLATESKREATVSAERNTMKDTIGVEQRKLKNLMKSITDDEQALEGKEAEMERRGTTFQTLKDACEADANAFTAAQKRFEAVTAGLSTNEDGEAATLQDQLMTAKQKAAEAATTIKQSEMELKHTQQVLREKQGNMNNSDAAYLEDKRKLAKVEAQIGTMEQELAATGYEEGSMESLASRRQTLQTEIRGLRSELDRRNAHRWELQYRDPEPGFDRRSVKGMVAKLLKVKDPKYAQALGTVAGGNLYSVITDTDMTSKKLLQKGQLQSRTTMIPLNKISGREIDPSVARFAEELVGRENVATALSCISYDPEVDKAMRFAFGHSFIVKDLNIAKQITYHPRIMTRSVTLDGDVVDPGGTLSGGARAKGSAVLLEVEEINKLQAMLQQKEEQLRDITGEISQIERTANRFTQLKEQHDMLNYELNNLRQRLAQTSFQQTQEEIEQLKQKIETLKQAMVDARQTQTQCNAKVKDLQSKLADGKGHRERELKAAEEDMKRTKKRSEESRKNWKKHEQDFETLRLEIEELQKGIVAAKEQAQNLEQQIVELQQRLEEVSGSSDQMTAAVTALKQQIKQHKDKMNSQSKELKGKYHQRDKLLKQNDELRLEMKKKENEITKVRSDNKDGYERIRGMEEKYTWIPEDKEFFGVKNTRYDYNKEDPQEAGRKLKKLQDSKDKMSRNVNQKAMVLLEREEEQYKEVIRRKQMVEDDKKKIQAIITDLDEEKKKKLKVAWSEVDENFGSIFSTLLPGSQAKLVPPDGVNFMKGLEVKVGFNGMWKEALAELSGGQRSLVALSLILAMLKYKPAPLYILDEVDAALDLSHTQNIGNMLKAHFKNSQFIIVSLKDGMFNNANVLFRTKFTDGMSGVTRTVNMANLKRAAAAAAAAGRA
ncbi:structural maintenance of chromosomes protein 2-like [Anopheles albimanus]|uniref:Structural maintenance of chromosomes protein n=1 Tax=Anopheles albimanus TaxID=7167 RepID=A0A182FUV1_ANOAL|nr:structural maintenance of chromosomes protein 2-like [Anopheles albimanus]